MSEVLIPPKDITCEVRKYGQTMMNFVRTSDFPEGLLGYPDHLMIKSTDASDFDKRVKEIGPWAEQVAFVEIDTRFLVAAQLLVPLMLTDHRPVQWVEIMEPKSPDGTVDFFGVEYAEFYYNDFNKAGLMMKKQKIPAEKRTDGIHRWWNIRMNEAGQEVRITDKPLSEIIGRELDDGTAKSLNIAA